MEVVSILVLWLLNPLFLCDMQVRYPTSVDLLRTSEDLSVMQAQTNGEMGGTYLNRTNLGKCTCKHYSKVCMRRIMQYMQVM